MNAIKKEINYVNNFMETMRENRYRKGDTFVANDLTIKLGESWTITASGSTCCAMVERGILSIDGTKYYQIANNRFESATEVTAQDILDGKVKGLFYPVKVYKVECDNLKEYVGSILGEYLD